jgi:hypothetical protein
VDCTEPYPRRGAGRILAPLGGTKNQSDWLAWRTTLTPMTNPTATERARVARAGGRSGYRRSININRALAPIDLLIDLMGFLLSPLGWAMKEMRERIGALLAHKLATQLRRTLAHAGIPVPALCDVDLIFWVSRTKPLLRDQAPSPAGGKRKGMRGVCAQQDDSISNARSPLAPLAPIAGAVVRSASVADHPYTEHFPQLSGTDDRSRIRGPPWLTPNQNLQTALGLPKRGRACWRKQKPRAVKRGVRGMLATLRTRSKCYWQARHSS